MRYFFVFAAILAVWISVIAIAAAVDSANHFNLYFTAQVLTVVLFYIGFWRK